MSIPYNLNIPAAANNPSTDQPNMQTNTNNIATYVAVDHVAFNTTGSGQHNQVTFAANNVPSVPTSPPVLFTNTVGSTPQLFFYSGASTTSSQVYHNASTGSTYLLGGIILKWGLINPATNGTTYTFDHPFPNSCYNVQVTINIASTVVPVGVNGFTASGFTFRTTGSGVPIAYSAIGF
jgi:hypothetical protein